MYIVTYKPIKSKTAYATAILAQTKKDAVLDFNTFFNYKLDLQILSVTSAKIG